MSDIRGLYNKYKVERRDGRDSPGGDKANARYFVLDLVNDPYAISAMMCYANNAKYDHPELAKDLFELLEELDDKERENNG
jgi:hypothetical protein